MVLETIIVVVIFSFICGFPFIFAFIGACFHHEN